MRATTKATEFKKAVKAALSLRRLNAPKESSKKKKKDEEVRIKGRLTVTESGLFIESTNMGAYVRLKIPSTVKRPGRVHVDLEPISKLRMSGDLEIEAKSDSASLEIRSKQATFSVPLDDEAVDLFKTAKPPTDGLEQVIKMPTPMLAAAASLVEIKPVLKQEDMRMQFQFRKGKKANRLDITGVDYYCYGRFMRISPQVKVRTPTKFILKPTALGIILDSVTAKDVVISVQNRPEEDYASLVRFKADDADIFYPTLDLPFQDAEEAYKDAVSGTIDCGFTATRKNMAEAINTVKTVGSGTIPLIFQLRVTPKAVKLGAERGRNEAIAKVKANNIGVSEDRPYVMYLNQLYFTEVISLAPDTAPLRIESWNRGQTIIKAENVQDGTIEYFLSQVDLQDLKEAEESSHE